MRTAAEIEAAGGSGMVVGEIPAPGFLGAGDTGEDAEFSPHETPDFAGEFYRRSYDETWREGGTFDQGHRMGVIDGLQIAKAFALRADDLSVYREIHDVVTRAENELERMKNL